MLKVDVEIDIASRTVNLRSDLLQRLRCRAAPAHRANQIPLQVQHPRAGRGQTSFQHGATRLLPLRRQLIRPYVRERKIVRVLDMIDQQRNQLSLNSLSSELLA